MTLPEAAGHIGEKVTYQSAGYAAQQGVIVRASARFVFVRFDGDGHAKACDAGALSLRGERP